MNNTILLYHHQYLTYDYRYKYNYHYGNVIYDSQGDKEVV